MSRKRFSAGRVLTFVIILGVAAGLIVEYGDEMLYFATGQDILDDLHADLAQRTRPTATPAVGNREPLPADTTPPGGSGLISLQTELGADGFPVQPRQHVIRYVVQPGDTIFNIASRFDIHPNTIFWANTGVLHDNVNLLHVGMELYILPTNGVYHLSDGTATIAEIASMYGVAPGDILYSPYNALAAYDSSYTPPNGLRIVVPAGRRDYVSWQAPIQTGSETGQANPEGILHPGSCRQVYTGPGGSGDYINPVAPIPYRITTDFVPWHPGTDLAVEDNVPIYAADTGVVVFAGWHRDGYGELVILDHGGGWTTYYGHLNERFVGCGDQVAQGETVGTMGMTGNATGIHLHFEVRQDDFPQNPADFIDLQDVRQSGGG